MRASASARVATALVASALLHLAVLEAVRFPQRATTQSPLEIELYAPPPPPAAPQSPPRPPDPPAPAPQPPAAPIPLPEAQIVSPPDDGESADPGPTRFLSDRDARVAEQSVRRGDGREAARGFAESAGSPQREAAAQPASKDTAEPPPRIDALAGLVPLAPEIARRSYGRAPAAHPTPMRRDILRYSAGPPGRRGTMDFLPDVREGDVTLLNTKAERYAPFVRRVATRVFQLQVISLRREAARFRRAGEEEVAVEAVMTSTGNLLSLTLRERSAVLGLDLERHLRDACVAGFFDPNPPRGVELADGNIHFLFRTRVRLYPTPDGRLAGQALFQAGLL